MQRIWLVAIEVNEHGYYKILGVCEGAKEDKASWSNFLRHLKERGLTGVLLFITDACMGLAQSLAEFYPESSEDKKATIERSLPYWKQ